jgi:hypothetical protein
MKSALAINIPERMGRILQLAKEEFIGQNGSDSVLHMVGLPENTDCDLFENQDLETIFFMLTSCKRLLKNCTDIQSDSACH